MADQQIVPAPHPIPNLRRGGPGRTKGSLNRVTTLMKEALARHIEETGERGNPLLVLASIYENEKLSPIIRARAADMVLHYLAPRLFQIEVETPDVAVAEEIITLQSKLRTLVNRPKE